MPADGGLVEAGDDGEPLGSGPRSRSARGVHRSTPTSLCEAWSYSGLVGDDFDLFHDIETDRASVVYSVLVLGLRRPAPRPRRSAARRVGAGRRQDLDVEAAIFSRALLRYFLAARPAPATTQPVLADDVTSGATAGSVPLLCARHHPVDDDDLYRRGMRVVVGLLTEPLWSSARRRTASTLSRCAPRVPPDVVLMDVRMLGMGGIEACRGESRGGAGGPERPAATTSDDDTDLSR